MKKEQLKKLLRKAEEEVLEAIPETTSPQKIKIIIDYGHKAIWTEKLLS
ncbi:MAG TPA: hypothetical protein VK071_06970 [Tissierellales bacterium]|nr:hypothetical protein [Tissierellales bacterium]